MKRQGLSFKDSDLLKLYMIICIVDNQPENLKSTVYVHLLTPLNLIRQA